MQSIEVMIYIVISIMIGSILIHFMLSIDAEKLQEDIQKTIDDDIAFEYDRATFIDSVFDIWADCGYGGIEQQYTVYVDDNGSINVQDIIESLTKNNYHKDLPLNKLIFRSVNLPSLLRITCNEDGLFIGGGNVIVIYYQDNDYVNCYIDENDYLQCDTPNGNTGVTNIILRAYNDGELVKETIVVVAVSHTLTFTATDATYISSESPESNFNNEPVVSSSTGKEAILLKFPEPLGVDPAKMVSAELYLTHIKPSAGVLPADQTIQIHITTTNWSPDSVTWNSPWMVPGGDYSTTVFGETIVSDTVTGGVIIEEVMIPITELVRSWINIPQLNQNLIITGAGSGLNQKNFYSDNALEEDYRPRIVVNYLP